MKFRTQFAGLASATLAVSVLALAAPAGAATTTHDADDPSFDPGVVAADLIGVGSDTTQHAVHLAAETWTGATPAPAFRVASFAATSLGNIALPSGDIARPNGSGAGKALLYGAGNNADVDFARSSSALNTNEQNAGLKALPFAKDTLQLVVSKDVTSHAPAALTGAQILAIYKCDPAAATWNQVGGTGSTTIKPMIPQTGSGTRSFFLAQLQALNGGTALSAGACWFTVQEHDPAPIQGDADALAPFSAGRAGIAPSAGHIQLLDGTISDPAHPEAGPGWHADRAVYNVVRGTSCTDPATCAADKLGIGLDNADVQSFFAENGYLCSNAARADIEAAGFKQLATPGHGGGACGTAVSSTTNFQLNQTVTTTTALQVTSPAAGEAHLVATVTGSSISPSGSVEFLEGATSLGVEPLGQGGVSVKHLTGLTPGTHTFTAKFSSDQPAAQSDSQADGSGVVKSASRTSVSFSTAPTFGKATTIMATVSGNATGNVSIKVGSAAPVTRALTSGKATLVVPANKAAGSYPVVATFTGTGTVATSTATRSLVIAKAAPVISETFPTATLVGKPGRGVVKVAIAGSTVKPTGKVTIKMGTKVVKAAVSLVNGQVTITLPKLTKGKHTLTIVYSGSGNVKVGSKSFTITQK
jgi:hypothetical protein